MCWKANTQAMRQQFKPEGCRWWWRSKPEEIKRQILDCDVGHLREPLTVSIGGRVTNVRTFPWVLVSWLTFFTGSAAESWTALPLQRRHGAVHHFVGRSDHGPVAGNTHTHKIWSHHTLTDNSCLCMHCDCDDQLLSLAWDLGALWSKVKGKVPSQIQCEMLLLFREVFFWWLCIF